MPPARASLRIQRLAVHPVVSARFLEKLRKTLDNIHTSRYDSNCLVYLENVQRILTMTTSLPVATVPREPEATRQKLLTAAFEEIYQSGFQSASLDKILGKAGVTKGALYHHFHSKVGLGYAVVDEVIRPRILEMWLEPVLEAEDPITGLQQILREISTLPAAAGTMSRLGCPLTNLIQEMAPLDEGFRQRLDGIVDAWRKGLLQTMSRAQGAGILGPAVNIEQVVLLLLAAVQGAISLTKSSQDAGVFQACAAQFADYLETLRSRPSN